MKKIADILEARYVGPITPDTVEEVVELYRTHHRDVGNPKQFARMRYQKSTDNQWDIYKPRKRVYAELVFRPDRTEWQPGQPVGAQRLMMTQDELMEYVKDYVKNYQLPYTSITTRGTNFVSVKFEEPDKKIYEASYRGNLTAAEVEKIYDDAFVKYKTPNEEAMTTRLRWKGTVIQVWSIGTQGSGSKGRSAFTSFKFEGHLTKDESLEWTRNFAKRHKVPFTDIVFSAGQTGSDEMNIDPQHYTAILYEE